MIKITNLSLSIDDQRVFRDININFGREIYLLSGQMVKRKTKLISEIAEAYIKYNEHIVFIGEPGLVYLPNYDILLENLTVKQNLDFFAKFFKTAPIKIKVLANHFELDNIINRKVNSLTSDLKQLVKLVCVLLNTKASIYLLDDFTKHLNRNQIDIVKAYIKHLKHDITVIMSKSSIHGVEDLKPRILAIKDRKLYYEENHD